MRDFDSFTKPVSVADWKHQLTQARPENMKPSLPNIEQIEAELRQGGKYGE